MEVDCWLEGEGGIKLVEEVCGSRLVKGEVDRPLDR